MIVGQLYPRTDVRRDGAYTIFYMGINVGAAIGTIIAGYLGETFGWSYGFGAAGIGMLLGLIVFVLGKPLLLGQGEPPKPLGQAAREWMIYAVGAVGVAIMWAADPVPGGRRRADAGLRCRAAGLCPVRGVQAATRIRANASSPSCS